MPRNSVDDRFDDGKGVEATAGGKERREVNPRRGPEGCGGCGWVTPVLCAFSGTQYLLTSALPDLAQISLPPPSYTSMPDAPPPQPNTSSPSMVVHPHQSKKKRFDDEQLAADLGLKPVQLQRRRVWRACECCRCVPISLTFPVLSPDHILDLCTAARRLSVTVSSLFVHNARSPSLSVLGCKRRTEQRLVDSEQTLPCAVPNHLLTSRQLCPRARGPATSA